MSKPQRIIRVMIYFWLAISSAFVFLLDLFMSVRMPENGIPMDIDRSFINQVIYLSTWATQAILWWSVFNLISMIAPKAPKWFSNKDNDTFVTATSFIVFIIYLVTFINSEVNTGTGVKVSGMDNWYKILKSVIEHFVNPVILIIFYFAMSKGMHSPNAYARNQSWYILIFFASWLLIMVIREAFLRAYETDPWTPFAYDSMDPWKLNPGLDVVLVLALLFVPYGIENLFNYLSNLSYKSMIKRYPEF